MKENGIKATFFCIGDNIRKYPEIFQQVIDEGHSIGNHTYNHLKGWETETPDYIENFRQCEAEICKILPEGTALFRPPYAKIKRPQAIKIREAGYKIIMWDILTADYDKNVSRKNVWRMPPKKQRQEV
ncbi:polysaccharide deacetylase family protein [Flavobacterium sp. 3HN19-14]|uniref:polysaccharide deacetylase family protein n=1 Tax=Flavobacterium sp. 3HN19-14 TaxID=3448133 RepID=UPI003EE35363